MTADIVSIEKVLNSRCSSSPETGVRRLHWGTLTSQHPPEKVINQVLRCCDIPRFSDGKLTHWFKDEHLFLGFETPEDQYKERLLHIESGMQQEAVYLACAALGLGTCIHNEGLNGTTYGEKKATSKQLIMEMIDPYKSGRFTSEPPGPEKPFVKGKNLTEPSRDGDVECLLELHRLELFRKSGSTANERDMSELLWAAKGRTPHLIRMHQWNLMWGLTIPTWGGSQDYTSVYLIKDDKLFLYRNWTKDFSLLNRLFRQKLGWTRGNPTHDIRFVRHIRTEVDLDAINKAIILCQNEKTARALWEVGYMLENMLLEAKSLGISFKSKILSEDDIKKFESNIASNAVAALLFE